jgi:hypothetical protein
MKDALNWERKQNDKNDIGNKTNRRGRKERL